MPKEVTLACACPAAVHWAIIAFYVYIYEHTPCHTHLEVRERECVVRASHSSRGTLTPSWTTSSPSGSSRLSPLTSPPAGCCLGTAWMYSHHPLVICASGAVAPELPGGCAGRAGRGRSVGPGAACSVLMCPASLDDYKGSDVTHILTGTSEIGHIHWDESIHSLE